MTDKEKTSELFLLVDDLCNPNFRKNSPQIESWIKELYSIYTDNYRHSYSEIFFKIQEVISRESDSETLEILGENLNLLMKKIDEIPDYEKSSVDYKSMLSGFKKFSDHIKLEIGRYNFIKCRFETNQKTSSASSNPNSSENLDSISKEVQDLKNVINQIRPVVTNAQKGLDGLDDKLENNKISSITALTIFSAVILAFSGGITFETGVLSGMTETTPYRLVFIVALSGFVLFNTIFSLLYLVSKMTGKKISTRCVHIEINANEANKCWGSCGDGYCKKKYHNVNIFCRLAHKYSYVLIINLILIYVLYSDFFLWISSGDVKNKYFVCSQAGLIALLVISYFIRLLYAHTKHKWAKYDYKVKLFQKIVSPDRSGGIPSLIAGFLVASLGIAEKNENVRDKFLNDTKEKELKEALQYLDQFADEWSMKDDNFHYSNVTYEIHKRNKRKMLKLIEKFKEIRADQK